MKRRLVKAMLGVSAAVLVLSGCSKKEKLDSTEMETLVLTEEATEEETEIITEIVTELQTEENATEEMTLDLSETEMDSKEKLGAESETSEEMLEETQTEALNTNERKAGVQETAEESENETDAVQEPEKADAGKKETEAKKKEVKQTEAQPETVKRIERQSETIKQTEKQTEPVKQTEKQTEKQSAETLQGSGTGIISVVKNEISQKPQKKEDAELEKETLPEVKETVSETERTTETEPETEEGKDTAFSPSKAMVLSRVRVRKESNTDADILATLSYGDMVTVVDTAEDWSKVRFQDTDGEAEGFIKSEFLSKTGNLYQVKEKINVRKEASLDSDKLGMLDTGAFVAVEQTMGEWVQISFEDEDTVQTLAYVKTEFIEKADESPVETGAAETETESTQVQSESQTDAQTDASGDAQTESESVSETEATNESESETDSAQQSESGSDSQSESESETEEIVEKAEYANGVEVQFQIMNYAMPEAKKVGILISKDNSASEDIQKEMTSFAEKYQVEILFAEVEDEMDIDIVASELVGKSECIFAVNDELIDGLLPVVKAYADEVEIPIIAQNVSQIENGATLAVEGNTLYYNQSVVEKFGLSLSKLNPGETKAL